MRQAVILVGGRGTRLGELAHATPKPLMPIAGNVRFLDLILKNYARFGIDDIILLAGHLGEQIKARYQGASFLNAKVEVIVEPQPAGTAGALNYAQARLDDVFLMANGDAFFDFNYRALEAALQPDDIGAIAIRDVVDGRRFGCIDLEGRHVAAFREKLPDCDGPVTISTGVYVLRRSILERIRAMPFSLETQVFPVLASERRLSFARGDGFFIDIGLPESLERGRRDLPALFQRPGMFFDRDGTLTLDGGYTYRPEDLRWAPGAIGAIRACNDAGRLVIVVTNQSGIARGMFTEAEMRRFHGEMQRQLSAYGAHVDAFYHCPFHEDGTVDGLKVANHPDRKPQPGMLRRGTLEWSVDTSRSVMFGDLDSDVAAGAAAGMVAEKVAPGDLLPAVNRALHSTRSMTARGAATAKDQLMMRAHAAQHWLFSDAFPLWWSVGFDHSAQTFHERVAQDGQPVGDLPRRIRVQARQTFAFAMAGHLGWPGPWREAVAAGVNVLLDKGLRPDSGTRHLLDPSGAPLDSRRDLYDTAFVIFALAHAARALGARDDLIAAAHDLLEWIDAHWRHPSGGYLEGDIVSATPRRQNPHMHLFEACLALHSASGDLRHLSRATALADLFTSKLFDPTFGALPEFFDPDWRQLAVPEGEIVEPGHHFEWSWLLHRYSETGQANLRPTAERLRVHAEVYGVDPVTHVTFDEVCLNGRPRARSARIWPQTERLKANLARYEDTRDPVAALAAAQAFDALASFLDTPVRGLWRERRAENGIFVEDAAPASSFYHITLAYAELIRVAALT